MLFRSCRYLTVMFGLAAAASCMPCQADWLNDLSLMPPVSVTMQPRKLLPDAEAVLDDAADDDALDVLDDDGALDELVPQAARTRLTAAVRAAAIHGVCFTVPPWDQIAGCPGITGQPPSPDCPKE